MARRIAVPAFERVHAGRRVSTAVAEGDEPEDYERARPDSRAQASVCARPSSNDTVGA